MTDSNYTAFLLIMDRSGSMSDIQSEAEGAINSFVDDQRKLDGKATLTFVRFDNTYEQVFSNVRIEEVTNLKLEPRGMTALDDAIGRGVTEFGESLAAMEESQRPGKVLVIIMTDGYENASKEWDKAKVKQLITQQQDEWNWEFIFLGANMDVQREAEARGLRLNKSRRFVATGAGMRVGGQSMATYASTYRTKGVGTFDSDSDQNQ